VATQPAFGLTKKKNRSRLWFFAKFAHQEFCRKECRIKPNCCYQAFAQACRPLFALQCGARVSCVGDTSVIEIYVNYRKACVGGDVSPIYGLCVIRKQELLAKFLERECRSTICLERVVHRAKLGQQLFPPTGKLPFFNSPAPSSVRLFLCGRNEGTRRHLGN
jgi:hypothetical protein